MTAVLEERDYADIHLKRSIRTVARRKREWLDNITINQPLIKKDLSLLWLDKNYPEVISVAAGPSLDTDLPELKQLRDGREVVCVDASLRYLVDNGIKPDYVISSDASEKILEMFRPVDLTALKNTKLILNVVAHPELARLWPGEVFWFVMANQFYDLDHKEMIQTMHSMTARIGTKLVPGGNVSSISLGFALSVRNAEKVYLFGHDFCWKEDMYCGGHLKHLAEERMANESRAGTMFDMLNARGEKVMTNLSLKEFANWHNEVIACARNRVVNCTSSTILNS